MSVLALSLLGALEDDLEERWADAVEDDEDEAVGW